jgi:putative endonuclease
MAYFVYILKSLKNGRYYTGSTKDIPRRLSEHNAGKTKGNKYFSPFELIYKEEYPDHISAVRREIYIKKQKSRSFIESLISQKEDPVL